MPDLEKWDPHALGLARNWIGRFIDDPRFLFPERALGTEFGRSVTPAFDVYETEHAVVVKAELPGFKPKDVDITVYSDRLTISGSLREQSEEEGANYLRRERRTSGFERTISFPSEVNQQAARASFKDGVLEVRIDKSEDETKRGHKVAIAEKDQNPM